MPSQERRSRVSRAHAVRVCMKKQKRVPDIKVNARVNALKVSARGSLQQLDSAHKRRKIGGWIRCSKMLPADRPKRLTNAPTNDNRLRRCASGSSEAKLAARAIGAISIASALTHFGSKSPKISHSRAGAPALVGAAKSCRASWNGTTGVLLQIAS